MNRTQIAQENLKSMPNPTMIRIHHRQKLDNLRLSNSKHETKLKLTKLVICHSELCSEQVQFLQYK